MKRVITFVVVFSRGCCLALSPRRGGSERDRGGGGWGESQFTIYERSSSLPSHFGFLSRPPRVCTRTVRRCDT